LELCGGGNLSVRIEKTEVSDSKRNGIMVDRCRSFELEDSKISENKYSGIVFGRSPDHEIEGQDSCDCIGSEVKEVEDNNQSEES
jgi:hypothetical protein